MKIDELLKMEITFKWDMPWTDPDENAHTTLLLTMGKGLSMKNPIAFFTRYDVSIDYHLGGRTFSWMLEEFSPHDLVKACFK